jgi:hypothetical protein
MLACENDYEKVVSVLLAQGANINAASHDGRTALMLASLHGREEVDLLLLAQGADVNAVTRDGHTALMLASLDDHKEVVDLLLKRADVTETIPALLAHKEINVDAKEYFEALTYPENANLRNAEIALDLLSRNHFNWRELRSKLDHSTLQNLQKEVAFLLAVVTPEEDLRNSIIKDFNEHNPQQDQIKQKDNYILGAGFEEYNNLKDFKSWYVKYLTDSGVEENEAKKLANQKFFDLVKNPESLQEALERDKLITDLASKSDSLLKTFTEIGSWSKKGFLEDFLKAQKTPESQKYLAVADHYRPVNQPRATKTDDPHPRNFCNQTLRIVDLLGFVQKCLRLKPVEFRREIG